jgi:hypothetical protein
VVLLEESSTLLEALEFLSCEQKKKKCHILLRLRRRKKGRLFCQFMIDIMFYVSNLVFIGTDVLSCSLLNKRLILWNIQWCRIMFYQSWTLSIVSEWTTRPVPRWPEKFLSAAVGVVFYFLILRHSWSCRCFAGVSWKRWEWGKFSLIFDLFSTFRDF